MALDSNVVSLLVENVQRNGSLVDEVKAKIAESKALLRETPKAKARRKRVSLKVLARVETLPAVLATLNCFLADNQSEVVTLILNVLPD